MRFTIQYILWAVFFLADIIDMTLNNKNRPLGYAVASSSHAIFSSLSIKIRNSHLGNLKAAK